MYISYYITLQWGEIECPFNFKITLDIYELHLSHLMIYVFFYVSFEWGNYSVYPFIKWCVMYELYAVCFRLSVLLV